MKKTFSILFLLIALNSLGQHAPFSPKCKEATLWTNQLGTYPQPMNVYNVNILIQSELNAGNWNLYDRFWIFSQGVKANTFISVAKPTSIACTDVNSVGFTAYNGVFSNGTSSYLNSNFTASTDAVNYSLNSATYGMYSLTNEGALHGSGVINGANYITIIPRDASNLIYFDANANGETTQSNTSSIGLFAIQRKNSTQVTAYRNATSLGTSTWSSTGLPTTKLYILSMNNGGTAAFFEGRVYSLFFIGSGAIDVVKQNTNYTHYRNLIGF